MNPRDIDRILDDTFDDGRVSSGEKTALQQLAGDLRTSPDLIAYARNRAFEMARGAITSGPALETLRWLEGVVKALNVLPTFPPAEAAFSRRGHYECLGMVKTTILGTRRTLDVCVFTITDDRVRNELLEAHSRGVTIRIISDNDKADDEGSDIAHLAHAGIPVRIDDSPEHMHHKFAIADRARVLTGSYNWTRSAEALNAENCLVTHEPQVVTAYQDEFDYLWDHVVPFHGARPYSYAL